MLGLCLSYVCLHALPGSQALNVCAFSSSIWNSNNGLRFNKLSLAHCPTFVCGVRTLPLSSDFKSCTVALLASFVQTDSIAMCFPQLADAYIDKRRLPLQGRPTVHRKTPKISYTGLLLSSTGNVYSRRCFHARPRIRCRSSGSTDGAPSLIFFRCAAPRSLRKTGHG